MKKRMESNKDSIRVEKLKLSEQNGCYRVSAIVDGEPLWFESNDHPLRIAPEGFAGLLLVPAMTKRRNLVFDNSLCPSWLENARNIIDIQSGWWGWQPVTITSSTSEHPEHYKGNKTTLCFSGGVDSFHSITTYPDPIDYIVTVHGYDVRINDTTGGEHTLNNVRQIADEYKVKPISIRTNMREHHIAGKRYRYSFEGALAAIGYLVDEVSTHIISSDYSRDAIQRYNVKTGSHWQTAPLRSSSDITIVHYGEDYTRDEKLRQIAHIPLIKSHLRVCQENLDADFNLGGKHLNCGKCCKCIRTIIPIIQTVGIEDFDCFANTEQLDQAIDQIATSSNYSCITYEKILTIGVERTLESSIRALIYRSRFINARPWLGRKGRKLLVRLFMAWRKVKLHLNGM